MLNRWKNAALQHLLMCISILNCVSNQEPRFFTTLDGLMISSPMHNESTLTFASCCLIPIMINSVLLSFSFNLSASIHFLMSVMQSCIALMTADCSITVAGLNEIYNCESSANAWYLVGGFQE